MMATTKSTRVKAPTKILPGSESLSHADTYDVVTSKPKGRVIIERRGTRETKLLRCKKSVLISTLNTRTIRSIHLQEELCGLAKLYKWYSVKPEKSASRKTFRYPYHVGACDWYRHVGYCLLD